MTRSVSGQVVLVLAAILAGGAGPAWAQGQPPVARPYQGLFGGDNEPVLRPQSLTVQGSVFAGYDDNVYAGQPGAGTGPGTIPGSGFLSGISLGLGYTRSFSRSRSPIGYSANRSRCI